MFTIKTFCGGICQTNGYALECPDGTVVVDAPEGMHDWLTNNQLTPKSLLLTHLHFDHVMDAAAIAESFGCRVFAHSELTSELQVPAATDHTAEGRRPLHAMLREEAERADAQIVLRSRGEADPVVGGVEPVIDPVMPELHAEGGLDRASIPFRMDMTDIAETRGRPRILLFELVPVGRVIERVGEVREEIQFVAET